MVAAQAYTLSPGSDALKCIDGNHVTDAVFAIGACEARDTNDGLVGRKPVSSGAKLVMNKYTDALTCSGAATEQFSVTTGCAPGFNPSVWLRLKSACSAGAGASETTGSSTGSATSSTTSSTTSSSMRTIVSALASIGMMALCLV